MHKQTEVLEYKCPCCNAGLVFGSNVQQMKCEYCENLFDLDTVKEYCETQGRPDTEEFQWEPSQAQAFDNSALEELRSFQCPDCAGELLSDSETVATFCPYCGNPAILSARLSGGLKPDGILPFQTTKEDAKSAFLKLCKGKPLLPKEFTTQQQLEKITGVYVPFWLYDCDSDFSGSYKATRIHRWSDTNFHYTRTEHFLLNRTASANFAGIPMDGSSKMDDVFMESIEPFDYGKLVDFETAYLSGYLADKYDVPSENGMERIRERVDRSISDQLQSTFLGYATVVPTSRQLHIDHSRARYVLLPVWMLNTRYQDKVYTFAMNGQSGKMTGSFPICPKRTAVWFGSICAGVTLLCTLVQMLL